MASLPPLYEALSTSRNAAADDALAEALPHLEEPHRSHAVQTILKRASPTGLSALIQRYAMLQPESQRQIVAANAHLLAALRAAIRDANLDTQINAFSIIAVVGNLRLVDLAAAGMRDASPRIRETAARTLQSLTDQFFVGEQETIRTAGEMVQESPELAASAVRMLNPMAEERGCLGDALHLALASFAEHQRLEVLAAAMCLPAPLASTLFDPAGHRRGKLTHALREIFEESDDPRFAPFAFLALSHAETRAFVARRIETRTDPPFFIEMLRHAWMLRIPAVGRGLQFVRQLSVLANGIEPVLAELEPTLQAAFPPFLAATGLPADQRVDLLVQCTDMEASSVRRAAVWQLAANRSQMAGRALEELSGRSDPVVQRIALRILDLRRRAGRSGRPAISASPRRPLPRRSKQRRKTCHDGPFRADHRFRRDL